MYCFNETVIEASSFGHRPEDGIKMADISSERNGIYIIDIQKTVKKIECI